MRAFLIDLVKKWGADETSRRAAALAFYTFLALSPLLIIMVSILGLLYGKAAAEADIIAQVRGVIGPTGASALTTIVENADSRRGGALGLAAGILLMLASASGVFSELQADLNLIWEVRDRPRPRVLRMLMDRLLTFVALLGAGLLLLVSVVTAALVSGFAREIGGSLPSPAVLLQAIEIVTSFALITLLTALLFKVLPDATTRWRDIWLGAALTALLFSVGKLAIGLYLGRRSATSSYGAAAGFVVLLLWVYYSAQILLLGAEFTVLYGKRRGGLARDPKGRRGRSDAPKAHAE